MNGTIKANEAFKLMENSFGDCFFASLRLEMAAEVIASFGPLLIKNNLLKPKKISQAELLKILNKQMGIIEYLIEKRLVSRDTIENIIKSIESVEQIKQILKDDTLNEPL